MHDVNQLKAKVSTFKDTMREFNEFVTQFSAVELGTPIMNTSKTSKDTISPRNITGIGKIGFTLDTKNQVVKLFVADNKGNFIRRIDLGVIIQHVSTNVTIPIGLEIESILKTIEGIDTTEVSTLQSEAKTLRKEVENLTRSLTVEKQSHGQTQNDVTFAKRKLKLCEESKTPENKFKKVVQALLILTITIVITHLSHPIISGVLGSNQ